MSARDDQEAKTVDQESGGSLAPNVRNGAQAEVTDALQKWLTSAYARGYADGHKAADALHEEAIS